MKTNKCIFCFCKGDMFHTVEHIVPESLGNTDDVLENCICDKCQSYFGKEIESYVLAKTPFGFWRTIAGTVNKKGKKPSFDPFQNPDQKGPIPDFHPYTDNGIIIHPADGESIIEATITNRELFNRISTGEKTFLKIGMTPKMLIYIGRFLGKIALELWCKTFGNDVFRKDFDELRQYVRNGTTKYPWPILHNHLLENLLTYNPINPFEEECVLYAYSFYEIDSLIVFCFDIGNERYSIIINQKYPPSSVFSDKVLSALCKNTDGLPNILYYGP